MHILHTDLPYISLAMHTSCFQASLAIVTQAGLKVHLEGHVGAVLGAAAHLVGVVDARVAAHKALAGDAKEGVAGPLHLLVQLRPCSAPKQVFSLVGYWTPNIVLLQNLYFNNKIQ